MNRLKDIANHISELGPQMFYIADEALDEALLNKKREPYLRDMIEYIRQNYSDKCYNDYYHLASQVFMLNQTGEEDGRNSR